MLMREVLGQYPTGVAVITAIADDGEALAMVVGTFSSVSLDPPLVGFMPMKTSYVFGRMRSATGFVVNLLAHDQEVLCRELTRSIPNKLDEVAWTPSETIGAPILPETLAYVECTFHSVLEGGDHYIVLGEVLHLESKRSESPLIFLQGGFGGFMPPAFLRSTDQELARAVSTAQRYEREIAEIANSMRAVVEVFARIGHDAAVVATTDPEAEYSGQFLGARYPLAPPFGEHFIALGGDEDEWFARARGMGSEDVEHFRQRLDLVRRQGWTYTISDPERSAELFDAAREYADRPLPASQRRVAMSAVEAKPAYPIDVLEDDATAPVGAVIAPVLGDGGTARFAVRARLGGRSMSGAELKLLGDQLMTNCELIAQKVT